MPNPERSTEHVPRSLRKQSLVDFTQREIEQYESGQIGRISSAEELQERFEYAHKGSVYLALRETELYAKRKEIKKRERQTAPPRVRELLNFVSQEIERFKAGEISAISSAEELGARFGYTSISRVHYHLKRAGLNLERRQIIKPEGLEIITPSTEWAWMMGVIAGGGHINNNGQIGFNDPNPELREAIKSRGEKLFNTNAHLRTYEDPKASPHMVFNNRRIVSELGNFTRDQYVTTVSEKHGWVLGNNRYIWSFLEGIFETRGTWRRENKSSKSMGIVISAARRNEVNFLAELLVRVGINNPRVRTNTHYRQGVSGLGISSLKDIKLFSENIHSVIPEKEEHLHFYRELDPMTKKFRKFTREEKIREWAWMTAILGRTPTSAEITQLKKFGIAKCWPKAFVDTFGMDDGGENFGNAKSTLENLVRSRQGFFSFDANEIQQARAEYERRRHQERKPRRRSKRIPDNDLLQEWIKARTSLGHVPSVQDLRRLKEQGIIRSSYITFKRRFGDGKSFAGARDALEKLAFNKEPNNSLQQYERASGKQIRYIDITR